MIETYIGVMYRKGIRDDEHAVNVAKEDEYYHGVCDICGESVDDYDVGCLVSPDTGEIHDCAVENDWVVIGHHLICDRCIAKVEHNEMDVEIKVAKAVTESDGK